MRIFAIRDEELPRREAVGYLLYSETSGNFYIELPDDGDPWEVPLLLSSFLQRGEHSVDAYWSRMWVQQRIVPPDRQNLGQVLKANGLEEYDEFALLMLAKGRCAQDSCYLAEVKGEQVPQFLKKRWEKKVEEVIPIGENHLLVFFQDGAVKKCDAASLAGGSAAFAPILRNRELFNAVAVQADGYGVSWGEGLTLSNGALYASGGSIPLSLEDFLSFLSHRVVNSAEAARMLGCSRQNMDDLTKRGALHPVRQDPRNRLFLKRDIQQRQKL